MITNLFTGLAANIPDELLTTLIEAANICIERIVSRGHASPEESWYGQDEHDWVIVLQGAARLRFEDDTLEMKSGDFVNHSVPQKTSSRMDDSGRTRQSGWPYSTENERKTFNNNLTTSSSSMKTSW